MFRFILPNPFLPVCSSTDSAESFLSLLLFQTKHLLFFFFWFLNKESTSPFPIAKGDFQSLLF